MRVWQIRMPWPLKGCYNFMKNSLAVITRTMLDDTCVTYSIYLMSDGEVTCITRLINSPHPHGYQSIAMTHLLQAYLGTILCVMTRPYVFTLLSICFVKLNPFVQTNTRKGKWDQRKFVFQSLTVKWRLGVYSELFNSKDNV